MARPDRERIVEITYQGTYFRSRSEELVTTGFYVCVRIRMKSGEAVLQGEARSRGSGAYPKLVVDGGEVRLDRAGAKEELCGYLSAREPFGHQPQYLKLPGCESCRMLGR